MAEPETDPPVCPVCGRRPLWRCHCPAADMGCAAGHSYYQCPEHPGKLIVGPYNHHWQGCVCQGGKGQGPVPAGGVNSVSIETRPLIPEQGPPSPKHLQRRK